MTCDGPKSRPEGTRLVTENTSATQSPAGADMVLLRNAAAAYKKDEKEKARAFLVEAASINPDNELVWMWRTSLARTVDEALDAVHRVLKLNPTNERALGWKAKLVARAQAAAATNGNAAAEAAIAEAARREEEAAAQARADAETAARVEEQEQPAAEGATEAASDTIVDEETTEQTQVEAAADAEESVAAESAAAAEDDAVVEEEARAASAEAELEEQVAEQIEQSAEESDSVDDFFSEITASHAAEAEADESEQTLDARADAEQATAAEESSFYAEAVEDAQPVEEASDDDDDPLRSLLAEKEAGRTTVEDAEDDDFFSPVNEDSEDERDRSNDAAASLAALLGGEAAEEETRASDLTEISEEESESIHSLWRREEDGESGEIEGEVEAESPVVTTPEAKPELWQCPICEQQSHRAELACPQCRAIVDFSRLPAMAENDEVDRVLLKRMIADWENQVEASPTAELHGRLAIAHLNLRQSNLALPHLLAGARLDREDKGLAGALEEVTRRPLIMVVDDSRTVQRMVASTLERQLYRVGIAEDGLQALAKLNDELPSLILLDITMPRMDGYQVCKVITGNQAFKHIPVVMLSGKDGFFDKVRGKMVGASDYITKPFEAEFLVKAVRGRLKK